MVQSFVLFWTVFVQFSGQEYMVLHPVTEAEWADFRKHARRMRNLDIPDGSSFVTPDTLLALQLRTVDEPFLPGLETFMCGELAEAFIPFIPLFLSPKTTGIKISFAEGSPTVAVACTISRLPKMCPKVEFIDLQGLGRDSVITDTASEMLLACNRDCLQSFYVDTPLTEEARKALCQLSKLSVLWAVVQGRTILPPVALPSLVAIYLEFEDCLNWLQGFHGATLENLEFVCFRSESRQIGDLLREFENVARKASAQNTLTTFKFKTSRSWNPNYSALLLVAPRWQTTVSSALWRRRCRSWRPSNSVEGRAQPTGCIEEFLKVENLF